MIRVFMTRFCPAPSKLDFEMQHLVQQSRLRRTCGIARPEAGDGSVHSNYKCIGHSHLLVMLLD
jgi:hypothetical protein